MPNETKAENTGKLTAKLPALQALMTAYAEETAAAPRGG